MRGDFTEATFPFLARLSSDARRDLAACRVQTIGARRLLLERGARTGVVIGTYALQYTATAREAVRTPPKGRSHE